MSDRSVCDCCSEDDTFSDYLLKAFYVGGTAAVIFCTTSYLIQKTIQHNGEIEELFSRLENVKKNHESSQDS